MESLVYATKFGGYKCIFLSMRCHGDFIVKVDIEHNY